MAIHNTCNDDACANGVCLVSMDGKNDLGTAVDSWASITFESVYLHNLPMHLVYITSSPDSA